MREKKPCLVVTFHTTAEAMATEQICQRNNIEGKLISAPRALSADCGIAWCGAVSTRADVERVLREARIEVAGIHELVM